MLGLPQGAAAMAPTPSEPPVVTLGATGSTSPLSERLVEALAGSGVKVAILDLNAELAERRAAEIAASTGGTVIGIGADVLDKQSLTDAKEIVNSRLGSAVYAAVPDPPAGVGSDAIKQAILYRPARLQLLSTASDPRRVMPGRPRRGRQRRGRRSP